MKIYTVMGENDKIILNELQSKPLTENWQDVILNDGTKIQAKKKKSGLIHIRKWETFGSDENKYQAWYYYRFNKKGEITVVGSKE